MVYTVPQPYRTSLISHTVSAHKFYWNYFSSFLILGFRHSFVLFNPTFTNFFFNKAINLIRRTCSKFYSRAFLFGFFDDYEKLSLSMKRKTDEFIVFYKLFLKSYNVIYKGFFWRGGGLTNFRKFKVSVSRHFFTLPRKEYKYRYYPTVIFSTYYSHSTYSLGYESVCSRVPLITPINPGVDPRPFPYPLLMNSYSHNIYFFYTFYFVYFFYAFALRFQSFKTRLNSNFSHNSKTYNDPKLSLFARRAKRAKFRKLRRNSFMLRFYKSINFL
jgi:hypothetical protein